MKNCSVVFGQKVMKARICFSFFLRLILSVKAVLLMAVLLIFISANTLFAQKQTLAERTEQAMLKATKFMVDKVSTNGGYVWYYLPDFSGRWGEMEAYNTMIWVQDGGTVSAGHMLLDAYHATGNEYF